MTNELSNRVEQNHCSGQCACKPSTKKLVDMSSNNNMIILVAVLITTASAIGLYVYLDTNSSEPINRQTGMLASEHRAPSSTAQGTASVSMEELLEKKKQAVLSYSREGKLPDTRVRLKKSFDEKILTANEYYGELAHMLSISVDAPASITKEVLESGNKYGRDVLLGNLGSNLDLPNSISASERNAIFDMVNGAKPELGGGIHELGFSDVFRYEDWLKSLKTYAPDEASFHKTLENLIQTRMADPREMLALQSAFQDEKFLNHIDPIARERYLFYISGYIKDYPGNSVAQSINKAKQDYLDDMKR